MASSTVEEKKSKAGFRLVSGGGGGGGAPTLLEGMKILQQYQHQSERKKTLNSELWHACAGPLVSLPQIGSRVYYFPQGHSEQVEVSTKGTSAASHIPNYPNLPSQLMCHVQNVTLHADKDTDEIYAQMTLQPMNPEKDVFPVIDFGIKQNKHPSEFFCKTLTASDTSTHGGFSVPRRAAEKLFPPLDYSMQPPTQELVVRDLHNNSWTFRHIYRGQPKRHLLTSGWSLLLSAKRLRAGDAVLFVRDEKSQLRLGVRRANRRQTTLPSSILSVDSMHIGVLAAAAHAAANRSPFTIFYNPRACPSEFVVPLVKYQKAVYGPQVSIGMRFGMMFETEESGKHRYMGMVVGISDIDSVRWPGSKWRNLQVEWDEPGRKQKRVSSWEIETPESLFVFPSLSSTLKRSLCPGFVGAETEWKRHATGVPGNGNVDFRYPLIPSSSSELAQMPIKPDNVKPIGTFPSTSIFFGGTSNRAPQTHTSTEEKPHTLSFQNNLLQNLKPLQNFPEQHHTMESSLASHGHLSEKDRTPDKCENQLPRKSHTEKPPIAPMVAQDQQRQLTSLGKSNEDILVEGLLNCHSQSLESQLLYLNQRQLQVQPSSVQQQLELNTADLHQNFTPQIDRSDLYSLTPCPGILPSQFTDADDWIANPSSYQSLAGILGSLEPIPGSILQDETLNPIVCSFGQEAWDPQLSYLRPLSHSEELSSCLQQDTTTLQSASNSCVLRDFPEESNDQSEIYSGLHFEVSNGGRAVVDLPFSGSVLDVFSSPGEDVGFLTTDNCLGSNISSTQDIQSQITTTSLGDPQGFSLQDFPDCTGGTSSRSNLDFDESSLLHKGQWQQGSPPLRTYTKVQMLGSVGRSIDITKFKNYNELRSVIACMFGVEAFFDDPGDSGWKLVYVDYENDVLLVGDDPWEEFVSCVRCIRILSPLEVQQMSEDGNQLISNTVM